MKTRRSSVLGVWVGGGRYFNGSWSKISYVHFYMAAGKIVSVEIFDARRVSSAAYLVELVRDVGGE